MQTVQTPDQVAFTNLFLKHKAWVCAIIRNTGASPDDWDDMYQEIALRAWKGFANFRYECTFKSWLGRVAKYTLIDRFRRLKDNIIHLSHFNIFFDIVDEPYAEHRLPVIESLSEVERRTLDFILQGLSYREISEQLGEPENRIRVRMHRLKGRLNKRYGKNDSDNKY
jgi:RNA polymerase sigma-70 factor (ECF subfamily)